MQLSAFYDVFLGAVIEGRLRPLSFCLDDASASRNAVVYRNTVFRGAAEALATAYPAVVRMAGEAYFEPIAVSFVQKAPPTERSLVGYGQTFPDFLLGAPGLDAAPYLSDVARLDRAWLEAHLASEGLVLTASSLSNVPPDLLPKLKLEFRPSVRLLALSWDIGAAWAANRAKGDAGIQEMIVAPIPNHVLLWRLENEVQHQHLEIGEAAFFKAIESGSPLDKAAEAAIAADEDFDTSLVFAKALHAGIFLADVGLDYSDRSTEA